MTIAEAELNCLRAWASHPGATWAWCCHHNLELEKLTAPAKDRIQFILDNKKEEEQVTRLNNFRPVLSKLPSSIEEDWETYRIELPKLPKPLEQLDVWQIYLGSEGREKDGLLKLHNVDVPNHTWNGVNIF